VIAGAIPVSCNTPHILFQTPLAAVEMFIKTPATMRILVRSRRVVKETVQLSMVVQPDTSFGSSVHQSAEERRDNPGAVASAVFTRASSHPACTVTSGRTITV